MSFLSNLFGKKKSSVSDMEKTNKKISTKEAVEKKGRGGKRGNRNSKWSSGSSSGDIVPS